MDTYGGRFSTPFIERPIEKSDGGRVLICAQLRNKCPVIWAVQPLIQRLGTRFSHIIMCKSQSLVADPPVRS